MMSRASAWLTAAMVVGIATTAAVPVEPAAAVTVTVPGCVVNPNDVVAWWRGQDALNAEVGPDLAGAIPFTDASIGRGFNFGGPEGAHLATAAQLPVLTSELTLEAWIRPTVTGQTQTIMARFAHVGGRNSKAYTLMITPFGELEFRADGPSGKWPTRLTIPVADAPDLFDGNFHHVAGTFTATTMTLFVDGDPVGSTPSRTAVLNDAAATEFRLGSSAGRGNPFWFRGAIDEPTIWRRALTANEIDTIHSAGMNAKSTCIFTESAGLVGPSLQFQADLGGRDAIVSPDGRYVLFTSRASDLFPVVTDPALQTPGTDLDLFSNARDDVVLLDNHATADTSDDTIELVALNSAGLGGELDSFWADLTPTASHIAFASLSNDLVPGDTLAGRDVFVRDRLSGTTRRVSVRSDGSQPQYTATGLNNDSRDPSISDDGSVVAFASTNRDLAPETNPVPGDTWQTYDIYVRDVSDPDPSSHVTERVTVGLGDVKADGSSSTPIISPDGRYVWFSSSATNLVAGDTNGHIDLFVHDRQTSTTTRFDVTGATGQPLDGGLGLAHVTPDGRYVLFDSVASTVLPGDTNLVSDVFLLDTQAPSTTAVKRVSGPVAPPSNGGSFAGSVSDDGRYVLFHSAATNLVAGDTNSRTDVFVTDLVNRRVQRISNEIDRNERPGASSAPSASADATTIVYQYQPPGEGPTIWRVDLNLP